jgi:endoribonuclease Dicer
MAKFVSNCKDTVDTKLAFFSTLTSNEFWAVLTVRHGIHNHIKLSDSNLKTKIDAFAEQQIRNPHMHEVRDSYIQKTIFVSKQLFVV